MNLHIISSMGVDQNRASWSGKNTSPNFRGDLTGPGAHDFTKTGVDDGRWIVTVDGLNNHRINQPTQVIQLAHTWGKIRSDWSDPEIGCCTLHATRTSPRDSPAAYGKQRQCGNNQTSEPKKATYEVTMVVLNGNWQKLYLYLRDTLIYQQLNGVVPSMTIQNTISAEPEMSPRRHIVPDVWDARRKHRQSESAAQETAEILHFTKSPGSRGWGYSFEIMDMGLSNKNWQMGPENRVLTPIFLFFD